MEIRRLRTFVALAEERHFGRAAARAGTTQSAVSQQLRRLEDVVGAPLVVRSRTGAALTAAGEALLPRARQIIAQAAEAAAAARRAAEGEEGQLTVALSVPALHGPAPDLVRAFRARWPAVALRVQVLASDEQDAALVAGEIDAGFMNLARRDPRLERLELGREPLAVALPADHPLASRERLDVAALADEPFVMLPRAADPALRAALERAFRQAGRQMRVAAEAVAYPVIVGLVLTGEGLAFLPPSLAGLGGPRLAVRPLVGRSPELPTYLARRAGAPPPVVANLLALATASQS